MGGRQAGVVGQDGGLGPVGAVEFGEDAADMRFHGARGHVESLADLRVRQARGDQAEDVAFGVGEPLDPAFGRRGAVVGEQVAFDQPGG